MIRISDYRPEPARVPVFVSEPLGPGISRVLEQLDQDPALQGVIGPSVVSLAPYLALASCGILLAHIDSSERMMRLTEALRMLAKQIEQGSVRVLVTYTHDVAEALPIERLTRVGVYQLIREPVHTKKLWLTINRALGSLPVSTPGAAWTLSKLGAGDEDQSSADLGVRLARKKVRVESTPRSASVVEVAPLPPSSECWLLAQGGAQRKDHAWVIRLSGPAPRVGRWMETRSNHPDHRAWQWSHNELGRDFLDERGRWVFVGTRPPEYHDDLWWFYGRSPSLAFHPLSGQPRFKFRVDEEDALLVASDSERSSNFLQRIIDSRGASPSVDRPVLPAVVNESDAATDIDWGFSHRSGAKIDSTIVTPLAAAFLCSELQRLREILPEQRLKRFCDFIARGYPGAKVEIWARISLDSQWVCIGSSADAKGVYRSVLENLDDPKNRDTTVVVSSGMLIRAGADPREQGEARAVLSGLPLGARERTYADQILKAAQGMILSLNNSFTSS